MGAPENAKRDRRLGKGAQKRHFEAAMIIRLDRTLARVAGEDALSFLQGLLTQSLDALPFGAPTYAGLLTPQGKVIADMIVWREREDAFLLDLAASQAEAVLRRLTLYKLRAKLTIERLEGLSVLAALDLAQPSILPTLIAIDPRFPDGALGWRFIADGPWDDDPAAYEALRLRLGVPDLTRDAAPEEVFALEALFEELHGVDFHKGCFVGQENVSRMKRRATTRKKFCPLSFEGAAPEAGTPVTAGPIALGDIRTGQPGRALGLVRLDRAQEALDKGLTLRAGETIVHLDPPDWLIMPTGKDEA